MKEPVDIGSRLEMFVDDFLIEDMRRVSLQLQKPVKREVVFTHQRPWESTTGGYYSLVQDGETIRLYYRGFSDKGDHQVTCMTASSDGVHFTRPKLGLHEFRGSKENNIVWRGTESHNLAPFVDKNPEARSDERYKAVGGSGRLYALCSPDGIHWKKLQEGPLEMSGAFDSLNVAFWDELAGCYRCFSRYSHVENGQKVRAIQSSTSPDFIHWTPPEPHRYAAGVPREHFYTNATVQCPGTPHIFLSFPKRFVPNRKKVESRATGGVSDAVFMSSRDGVHWDRRFLEAWVRPGLDERNWTDRNNMPAWGIVQISPAEFSVYISEHYRWDDNRLRRMTIRRHGFVSVHAGYEGGEMLTRPVRFSGRHLILNFSTSAVGSVLIEIQDEQGRPLDGYRLSDMEPLYGDELDGTVAWKNGRDLAAFIGKPVRFRFLLKDADLFALRTGTNRPEG